MQWVGSTYLEAMAPSAESALERSEFLNAWKDNLPEAWTKEVALSKLPVSYWPWQKYGRVLIWLGGIV